MATPAFDARGYVPFGQPQQQFGQVVDRGRTFGQVVDRGPQFGQVVDRGPQVGNAPMTPAFGQVVDRGTGATARSADPSLPPGTPVPATTPATTPTADPFEDWYKNTIQANPNKYDTNRSKAQWQAWFPLWDASSGGFKSSKVDVNGNPIQGNNFEHPDACPPGMAAYGQNTCAPVGYHGSGGGGGFNGSGYSFGGAFPGFGGAGANGYPVFQGPTGVDEMNDPGYQFRLKQGRGALEASAAARGVLNTGGTLQGVLQQGQDYASSEFGNVWNRAKDIYGTKVGAYQSAWDAYRFAQDEKFRQAQLQAQIDAADLAATNYSA